MFCWPGEGRGLALQGLGLLCKTVKVHQGACCAGRKPLKPCDALSEEDVRDIQNLDCLVKAWRNWHRLLDMRVQDLEWEADCKCIGMWQPTLLPPHWDTL